MYQTRLRLDDGLAEKMKLVAKEEGRSINNLIVIAISDYVGFDCMTEEERQALEEYERTAPNMKNYIRDAEDKEEALREVVDTIVRGLMVTGDAELLGMI